MLKPSAVRGPHGSQIWLDGPVGLGHLALHISANQRLDPQPVSIGQQTICLHGRLDNRAEIAKALTKDEPTNHVCDARLALMAYQAWGLEAWPKFAGDFVFVIWDAETESLICVRDRMGLKPFHYMVHERVFAFGSDVRQVLAVYDRPLMPNKGMIAEYLASHITSNTETLYEGIMRLEPAHMMTVTKSEVRIQRYWDPNATNVSYSLTDAEREANYAHAFSQAVKQQSDVEARMGVSLSGGIDSSTVMAALVQHRDKARISAYSLCFEGLECDESESMREIASTWGVSHQPFSFDPPSYEVIAQWVRRWRDFPDYPNLMAYKPLKQQSVIDGSRIMFSGLGADDWTDLRCSPLPDMIARFRWLKAAKEMKRRSAWYGWRRMPGVLARQGVWPLLPVSWRRKRFTSFDLGRNYAPWLNTEFLSNTHLSERIWEERQGRFPSYDRRAWIQWLEKGYCVQFGEAQERVAAEAGVEMRFPFSHKDVVEIGLGIPPEYKWLRPANKWIVRRCFELLKPPAANFNFTSAEGSPIYMGFLKSLGANEFFQRNLAVYENGWIDAEKMRAIANESFQMYDKGNSVYAFKARPLWMVAGIELWLENAFG